MDAGPAATKRREKISVMDPAIFDPDRIGTAVASFPRRIPSLTRAARGSNRGGLIPSGPQGRPT
jgi:hypothetical protein